MKSIWKGSIAFGLVNIPITLYSAVKSHAIGFTLLHDKCHTPLKYHRWCPHCDKEVRWDQTEKGLKKADGSYFILTQDALKELRPEKTEEINIVSFVDADQVDAIYLDEHYYVDSNKKGDTAYALFMAALVKLNKVAVGSFVMRDKEHPCILHAYNNYFLLTTLHYVSEVRGLEDLAFTKKAKVDTKELKLAEELIKKLSVKSLDMSQFKDTFAQEIKELLKKKEKGLGKRKKVVPVRRKKTLTDSLRESLATVKPRSKKPHSNRPVARAKKR